MQTKAEIIEKLIASRQKLEATLARLAPEQREAPGVVGVWSAKDVLAHLAEWQEMHIHWMEAVLCGQAPAVPAPGFTWKSTDVDRLNQAIYEKHCARSWDDVYPWAQAVQARFLAQIERLSEDDLHAGHVVPFTSNLATWYSHYAMHDAWAQRHIHHRWVRVPRKAKAGA